MYIKTCLLIRIVSASLSESYSNVSCILIVYVRKKIISNVKMKNCNEMEENCDIIFVVIILIKTYFWLPIYLRSQKYINKSWFIESCSIQTLSFLFTQKYNSIYLYLIAIYFNKLRQGYQRSKIQKNPNLNFLSSGGQFSRGVFTVVSVFDINPQPFFRKLFYRCCSKRKLCRYNEGFYNLTRQVFKLMLLFILGLISIVFNMELVFFINYS